MKKKSRILRYKLSYEAFWKQKGDYGLERIRRAQERKNKRKAKPRKNKRFTCEMGYYDCELRGWCNGDC